MARNRWFRAFDISTRPGRDLVLFVGGLAGVVHETFLTNGERQYLLIFFGVMMGLPAYLAARPTADPKEEASKANGVESRP